MASASSSSYWCVIGANNPAAAPPPPPSTTTFSFLYCPVNTRLTTTTRRRCKSKFVVVVNCSNKRSSSHGSSSSSEIQVQQQQQQESTTVDCVGTGLDVECTVDTGAGTGTSTTNFPPISSMLEWALLISPFFFWGTSMVAMKQVLPKTGPFFISSFRLIPSGLLLVAFAFSRGRKLPSGFTAWLSISLFGLIDAACFQGFLAQGLQRTSAGLGSVIIDSQPLSVAVLAMLLFGESIGFVGAAGLFLGVVGLLFLEVPALVYDETNFSLWGSGEWWMLLAAQSMAVGTVMVRWVSKYSDPVMATGWHMVIGGLPLAMISILNHDPVLSGSLDELTAGDVVALLYTSIFGSAISYGVYFYNATRGSLTKLSSLTFLTPMFASLFGFLYLDETFSPLQLLGAFITVVAIYMVNYENSGIMLGFNGIWNFGSKDSYYVHQCFKVLASCLEIRTDRISGHHFCTSI